LLLSNQSSPNIAVLVDVFGGDREITRWQELFIILCCESQTNDVQHKLSILSFDKNRVWQESYVGNKKTYNFIENNW
jgi:hypothetical protein